MIGPIPDSEKVEVDTLCRLSLLKNYNRHIYKQIEPFLGNHVLEIGCGNGNITAFLMARRSVIALDKSELKLKLLSQRFPRQDNLKIIRHDIEQLPFLDINPPPDTIICLNVLEHIRDEDRAMRHIAELLTDKAKCILLLPAQKAYFSPMDKILGHFRRYDADDVRLLVAQSGLKIEKLVYLNFLPGLGWWFNFVFLKREKFLRKQLLFLDKLVFLIQPADTLFRRFGLNILTVCCKPGA
ncbi:MAG: methyltransferase [Candidatus Omnitrophota bacterium]|jgi:SAM-dependent methyltransferase